MERESSPTSASRLDAASSGDQRAFSELTEPYRRELQLHCYRLLGSVQDAEDMVQETLLRAWKRIGTFEGRGSLRSWLYKIATNACLDLLEKRPRRRLPQKMRPPANPASRLEPPLAEPIWLEPYPDGLIADPETGPDARYSHMESVTLAFIAVLQNLPPRQRAVLILLDVLDWRARETAELLESTVSAVNSALHRARASMAALYHALGPEAVKPDSLTSNQHPQLDRYLEAWDAADVAGLVALLKEDATFSMPPVPSWYLGREAIGAALTAGIFAGEARRRWRLLPVGANRQLAFAVYQRGETGRYTLFGIQLVRFEGDLVAEIATFIDPSLFRYFNLAAELPG